MPSLHVNGWALRAVTAAALGVDVGIHLALVSRYAGNRGAALLSQGDLFRLEAIVAAGAAVAVLVTNRWWGWALALAVSASAWVGVVLYTVVDVGMLGPVPDMYEPAWYPLKVLTTVAEGVAVVTSALGLRRSLRVRD